MRFQIVLALSALLALLACAEAQNYATWAVFVGDDCQGDIVKASHAELDICYNNGVDSTKFYVYKDVVQQFRCHEPTCTEGYEIDTWGSTKVCDTEPANNHSSKSILAKKVMNSHYFTFQYFIEEDCKTATYSEQISLDTCIHGIRYTAKNETTVLKMYYELIDCSGSVLRRMEYTINECSYYKVMITEIKM